MKGDSILITGGTGSFGSAFARYALEAGAERICIFSRGEHRQAEMREDFGATDQERLRWFIGDVRDRDRLRRAMEGADSVIHAAALKRVEVGEYNPIEMARTNVDGAINVIEAAQDAAVKRVVALSSDKACAPYNAYGASKLMAEKLFIAANSTVPRRLLAPRFAVTRYGNVSGSQGSVIPRWREMLKATDALPVTHPSCTRFWMTIDEAVRLVAWTLANMHGGEIVVPSLPAYSVPELAIAMGATRCPITGLRPGEKVHEVMISEDEAMDFFRVGDYWVRWPHSATERRLEQLSSDRARRMSVAELQEALRGV